MEPETDFKARTREIITGNNVFIRSIIVLIYGAHIINNMVIGTGNIVTKYVPDGAVAQEYHVNRLGNLMIGKIEV